MSIHARLAYGFEYIMELDWHLDLAVSDKVNAGLNKSTACPQAVKLTLKLQMQCVTSGMGRVLYN